MTAGASEDTCETLLTRARMCESRHRMRAAGWSELGVRRGRVHNGRADLVTANADLTGDLPTGLHGERGTPRPRAMTPARAREAGSAREGAAATRRGCTATAAGSAPPASAGASKTITSSVRSAGLGPGAGRNGRHRDPRENLNVVHSEKYEGEPKVAPLPRHRGALSLGRARQSPGASLCVPVGRAGSAAGRNSRGAVRRATRRGAARRSGSCPKPGREARVPTPFRWDQHAAIG